MTASAVIGAPTLTLENEHFRVAVNPSNGVLTSLYVKANATELVAEPRLADSFRISMPLPGDLSHYIEGREQKAASAERIGDTIQVTYNSITSAKGSFPIKITTKISLEKDTLRFSSRVTNGSAYPVVEFWYPRIGGMQKFGSDREARLSIPAVTACDEVTPFARFPSPGSFGAEAAEWSRIYGRYEQGMPWWDLFDAKSDTGLYLGYHDPIFRLSSWHTYLYPVVAKPDGTWLTPEQTEGRPIGIVFSHVRFPFLNQGETLDSGEFIIRVHHGDWHTGSRTYREWFMAHFPFDSRDSWLRRQTMWFTSILYQPEDKVIADYATYDRWTQDAHAAGIHCHELIGWDKGGLERDYPEYIPEEKLGGHDGFRRLLQQIKGRGDHCLVFINYNILDSSSDWFARELHQYAQQDAFGRGEPSRAWGESTLLARQGHSVRRHVIASVTPGFKDLLEGILLERVRDGAEAFQIDKLVIGSLMDFNPLNVDKPDVALYEGLVQGIAQLHKKCREINPNFRFAMEAQQDRLMPYGDVYYRSAGDHRIFNIAPLRYVFPEWTSCHHVGSPYDYDAINAAVMSGAVICVEPKNYQASLADPLFAGMSNYLKATDAIRQKLLETIFLGNYYDNLGAEIITLTGVTVPNGPSATLHYRVHGHRKTDKRAIVVVNSGDAPVSYQWRFTDREVKSARLYAPYAEPRLVNSGGKLKLEGKRFQVIVEE